MGFDSSEPRDKSGKWTGGAARGHNAGGGNRELAVAISKGVIRGVAEGVVASTVIGAITGGVGEIAAPALIARAAVKGALAGARSSLHPVHIAIGSVIGGNNALQEHREKMMNGIREQHKRG